MKQLVFIVEGQTEEQFVKECLKDYLKPYGIDCRVTLVKTGRDKNTSKVFSGGTGGCECVKKNIQNWLKGVNSDTYITTMFDFYELPNNFPGLKQAENISDIYEKIKIIETGFQQDIDDRRFIPYIQLHEFEALIFAKPEQLNDVYFDHETEIEQLKKIARGFPSPEHINHGYAPSERIKNQIREYDKVIGAGAAAKIPMTILTEKCRHFREWIEKLTDLSKI